MFNLYKKCSIYIKNVQFILLNIITLLFYLRMEINSSEKGKKHK